MFPSMHKLATSFIQVLNNVAEVARMMLLLESSACTSPRLMGSSLPVVLMSMKMEQTSAMAVLRPHSSRKKDLTIEIILSLEVGVCEKWANRSVIGSTVSSRSRGRINERNKPLLIH